MKHPTSASLCLWAGAALLVWVPPSAVAQSRLPESPGKDLLEKNCSQCHGADAVVGRRRTPDGWRLTLKQMVNRGAEIPDADLAGIEAYLVKNFSPEPVPLPPGEGRDVVERVCTACHGTEVLLGHEPSLRSWSRTIDVMRNRGAKATNAEFEAITKYLVDNFGYVPIPSNLPEDPNKKVVERVCGPCHGVDLFWARTGTARAWANITEGMIGRGAKVTDEEFDQVVAYLAKYFNPVPEQIDVNTAPTNHLVIALGINVLEAESIIRYREANGGLKSWEDFSKVPNLDLRKLVGRENRARFE